MMCIRDSLLDSAYKIYSHIINNKLRFIEENITGEERMGLRKSRSTIDAIFVLNHVIEKRWKFNLETHIALQRFCKIYKNLCINMFHQVPNAVSYTHLDVYKRQE